MKSKEIVMSAMAALAMVIPATTVMAQEHAMHTEHASDMSMPGNGAMTRGEIRKWDAVQNKVTLRHEEIKNLMMPPMTMVFVVSNPSQMQGLKVGDKVSFEAAENEGNLIVTKIQKR